MDCAWCKGTGFVCEDHPTKPMNHDDCGGAGMPCENPNTEHGRAHKKDRERQAERDAQPKGSTMAKCDKCKGSGQVTCKTCAGAGSYASIALGVDAMLAPCPKCGATGKVTCRTCDGSGRVS
jgi:hypothetical protein